MTAMNNDPRAKSPPVRLVSSRCIRIGVTINFRCRHEIELYVRQIDHSGGESCDDICVQHDGDKFSRKNNPVIFRPPASRVRIRFTFFYFYVAIRVRNSISFFFGSRRFPFVLCTRESGQPSRRPEDACNSPNFDAHATDSITLVGKSLIANNFQVFVGRPSAISR